ncbi:MAG: hypothetical protein ACI9AX_002468, partial [Polaromonas sp.]
RPACRIIQIGGVARVSPARLRRSFFVGAMVAIFPCRHVSSD